MENKPFVYIQSTIKVGGVHVVFVENCIKPACWLLAVSESYEVIHAIPHWKACTSLFEFIHHQATVCGA